MGRPTSRIRPIKGSHLRKEEVQPKPKGDVTSRNVNRRDKRKTTKERDATSKLFIRELPGDGTRHSVESDDVCKRQKISSPESTDSDERKMFDEVLGECALTLLKLKYSANYTVELTESHASSLERKRDDGKRYTRKHARDILQGVRRSPTPNTSVECRGERA